MNPLSTSQRPFGTRSDFPQHFAKPSRIQQVFDFSHRATLLLIFGTCSYLVFSIGSATVHRIKTKKENRKNQIQAAVD